MEEMVGAVAPVAECPATLLQLSGDSAVGAAPAASLASLGAGFFDQDHVNGSVGSARSFCGAGDEDSVSVMAPSTAVGGLGSSPGTPGLQLVPVGRAVSDWSRQ